MERVFKKVLTILNQNAVYHSVKQEGVGGTEFYMVDIYSVNIIVESPIKMVGKKRAKRVSEPQFVSVPFLQIKYNQKLSNFKIVLDNECIYNNDNFQYEEIPVGYAKNFSKNKKMTEAQTLKKILYVCKKKSTANHLDLLGRAKDLLAEQREILLNGGRSR